MAVRLGVLGLAVVFLMVGLVLDRWVARREPLDERFPDDEDA